jgi:hypothetical protein
MVASYKLLLLQDNILGRTSDKWIEYVQIVTKSILEDHFFYQKQAHGQVSCSGYALINIVDM